MQSFKLHSLLVAAILLMSFSVAQVRLALAQNPIEISALTEEVTVTPSGTIQVSRNFKLTNIGNATMSSTTILLPKGSSDITALDELGSISSTVADNDTGRAVTVTFRYPLKGVVANVTYHDSYAFSIHYTITSNALLTQPDFGKFHLSYNATTGVGIPVPEFTMVVSMPEGSSFTSSEPAGYVTANGLIPTVSMSFMNLQPNEEYYAIVNYSYLSIWSAFRPTLWVGAIVAIVGAILLTRHRTRKAGGQKTDSHTKLLQSYVNSLDEESGLWEDLDQLEQAFDDGSIGRKDYNVRRRILDERGRRLSESLSQLKEDLRAISPKYSGIVERIETSEGEMAALRSSSSRLRSQFRAGRISRSSFENQSESQRRQAGKVKSNIETMIMELRGEIG
jgi:hypothetical protein